MHHRSMSAERGIPARRKQASMAPAVRRDASESVYLLRCSVWGPAGGAALWSGGGSEASLRVLVFNSNLGLHEVAVGLDPLERCLPALYDQNASGQENGLQWDQERVASATGCARGAADRRRTRQRAGRRGGMDPSRAVVLSATRRCASGARCAKRATDHHVLPVQNLPVEGGAWPLRTGRQGTAVAERLARVVVPRQGLLPNSSSRCPLNSPTPFNRCWSRSVSTGSGSTRKASSTWSCLPTRLIRLITCCRVICMLCSAPLCSTVGKSMPRRSAPARPRTLRGRTAPIDGWRQRGAATTTSAWPAPPAHRSRRPLPTWPEVAPTCSPARSATHDPTGSTHRA